MDEEQVEVELEDLDEVVDQVLVEEEGEQRPQALEFVVVLERQQHGREHQRKVRDLVKVDGPHSIHFNLITTTETPRAPPAPKSSAFRANNSY